MGQLPSASRAKASRDKGLVLAQKSEFAGSVGLVGLDLLDNLPLAGIDEPGLAVPPDGAQHSPVVAPHQRVAGAGLRELEGLLALRRGEVPDFDAAVQAHGSQDVAGHGVEGQDGDFFVMASQRHERLDQVFLELFGDAPDSDHRVFGASDHQVFVERAEFEVGDFSLVTDDFGMVGLDLFRGVDVHDTEDTAAAAVPGQADPLMVAFEHGALGGKMVEVQSFEEGLGGFGSLQILEF